MRIAAAIALSLILASRASGVDQPAPIELVIHPRAIETPLLKYRLFPAEAELKPGNAVPILLRLPWEQANWMNQVFPTLKEWESRPLNAPEWAASGGVLPANFYNEMKRAAFRRDASWEYPIGETSSPYFILLPDVQGLRGFLNYGLTARIRYHLARGELAAAREGILVGLANARHLAQTPFFVNQLVALAVHRAMLDRTAELISQPACPNLFWALSALPESLIELDRAASLQGDFFAMSLPGVNDLDRPREAWEWRKMAEQLNEIVRDTSNEAPRGIASCANHALLELPDLLGITPEKVAAMTDEEAAIRWYVYQRIRLDQRTAAILVLPPREAWPLLHQLRKDVEVMRQKTGTKESESLDATPVYVAAWSLKRKIASLRIIEAVRDYLAPHDGKLPGNLDDIRNVPIPLDPMTGEPFHWRVDGQTATLKAPSLATAVVEPDWTTALANAMEYRLEVKTPTGGKE